MRISIGETSTMTQLHESHSVLRWLPLHFNRHVSCLYEFQPESDVNTSRPRIPLIRRKDDVECMDETKTESSMVTAERSIKSFQWLAHKIDANTAIVAASATMAADHLRNNLCAKNFGFQYAPSLPTTPKIKERPPRLDRVERVSF